MMRAMDIKIVESLLGKIDKATEPERIGYQNAIEVLELIKDGLRSRIEGLREELEERL